MTPANLFGSLLFSAIGLAAFVYAKKSGAWKAAVIGIALMVYPYFISDTFWMYGIGALLSLALFIFRD